jgi:chaperonin GroEL
MPKNLVFSSSARQRILSGVNQLADAVQVTLGPKGRNVLIEQPWGAPRITKDGVSVAKAIELPDRVENLGAQLVKSVASKTNDEAGDGTTTATVLARAIYAEGVKAVEAGLNPMDVKRGIDAAVEQVVAFLGAHCRPVDSSADIAHVATISANGDAAIGQLIASAMDKVGREGVITVVDGSGMTDELSIVEGLKFDRGFLSPYFVTDARSQTCEMDSPYILTVSSKIGSVAPLVPVLEKVIEAQRPLLIIADDVEGEALSTLVINRLRSSLQVCAVKAPGFGETRRALLGDICAVSGAALISPETGLALDEAGPVSLGSARRVVVTKDSTLILDGHGDSESILARCEAIRSQLAAPTDSAASPLSSYERERLNERLAKLSGGVAVIKVGGCSELEVGEKRDRYEDALCATRAAVAEGVLPGGGVALLRASTGLSELAEAAPNFDQKVGVQLLQRALTVPCRAIADNAGNEGVVVVSTLLGHGPAQAAAAFRSKVDEEPFSFGFDAASGRYGDLYEAGVIDPAKVVRSALVDAASVAGLMTVTEAAIVDTSRLGEADKNTAGM